MNLETYKSLEGRIGRQTWWLSQIVMGLVMLIPYGIIVGTLYATTDTSVPEPFPSTLGLLVAGVLGLVMVIALFWASIAINTKRWHDHEKSGWYQLLGLVPFVNIWVFIKTGFLRGTEGPNKYGPDPIAD
jgi:uncharacterized membrane protein YhaH (DUF805 family)